MATRRPSLDIEMKDMKSNNFLTKIPEYQPQQQFKVAITYTCHMHPITQLSLPDFMDKDRSSTIDIACTVLYAMLPMTLNFLLNSASLLANIYIIGKLDEPIVFVQISLGFVFSNLFLYYLIDYVSTGFAIICSYFSEKEEIGYLYQKTLGVCFLICIVVTPLVYLSDRILLLLHLDQILVEGAADYSWALVPSYYLYAFLAVNKNYLQSQGYIFTPILLHLGSFILHIVIAGVMVWRDGFTLINSAWLKNFTDAFCCITFYWFLVRWEPTKQSWVEWSMKATNNIGRFVKEILYHQFVNYFEVILFQVLCLIACELPSTQTTAHFSLFLLFLVLNYCFTSLAQCSNQTIAASIEENRIEEVLMCKKKIALAICLTLFLTAVLGVIILQFRGSMGGLFVIEEGVVEAVGDVIWVFGGTVAVQGLNCILTGISKTLQVKGINMYWSALLNLIGLVLSWLFCIYYEYGIWGLWMGWLVSLTISMMINLKKLLFMDFEDSYFKMGERYKTVTNEVRQSRAAIVEDE